MLVIVLALMTQSFSGASYHFSGRGPQSLWWCFSTFLQMLAAEMGTRSDKILEFQESDNRALNQVWVTELYRIVSTFIMFLIRID